MPSADSSPGGPDGPTLHRDPGPPGPGHPISRLERLQACRSGLDSPKRADPGSQSIPPRRATMPAHPPQPSLLRRLRAVLLAFVLIVPPVTLADEQPASAWCPRHEHTTEHWVGWSQWSSTWQIIPHNSNCRDLNVSKASRSGSVKGQYLLRSGRWVNGTVGWRWVRAGVQPGPWPVLVSGLRNGTPYRVVAWIRGTTYLTPV